ncbi:hypothetical protein BJX76DRAFT_342824 [Aspergillus varians]
MTLYKCISCDDLIQATKARLSCASCTPRMTLCANCYILQNYPPQHQNDDSHPVSLHKHSGFLPVPPPPPPRAQPITRSLSTSYGPPRRRPMSAAYSDVPPRKPPRPTKPEARNEVVGDAPNVQNVPAAQPPPLPTPSEPLQQSTQQHPPRQSQSQSQSQSAGWTRLLNDDMKPSPAFIRLIEELFRHLDPQSTGFLSPEVYSEYLEVCGAPENHNTCQSSFHFFLLNITNRSNSLTTHYRENQLCQKLKPRLRHG